MSKHNFTKLVATVALANADGQEMKYTLVGGRMNEKTLSDVPAYLAELAKTAMTGVEDKDIKALQTQNKALEDKAAKLAGELENAHKNIAEMKKK